MTVNGKRHRDVITKFLRSALHNIDTEGMWFQQDGTTCHAARATIAHYCARNLRADVFHEVVARTGVSGRVILFRWTSFFEATSKLMSTKTNREPLNNSRKNCQRQIANISGPELKPASVAEADVCPISYVNWRTRTVCLYNFFVQNNFL